MSKIPIFTPIFMNFTPIFALLGVVKFWHTSDKNLWVTVTKIGIFNTKIGIKIGIFV